jgi:AcrR family transcriptional regulator
MESSLIASGVRHWDVVRVHEGDRTAEGVDGDVVTAAIDEARDLGVDVSAVSMTRVARRAGISRATLFRRIGSREALEAAVRSSGVDPGTRRSVRDRALQAALEVAEREGLEQLTLEQVARRAGCSVTAVHHQFDGRDGLLAAVFERYSPIVSLELLLTEDRPEAFEEQVRRVYEELLEVATRRRALLGALVSNVLGRPSGPIAGFAQRTAFPRLQGQLGGWLTEEAARGNCRPLPVTSALPLLIGPLLSHLVVATLVERDGGALPSREAVVEELTLAFCRAVAP